MDTIEVGVTGMTCGHCVSAVSDEVSGVPGVGSVSVDLQPDGVSTVRISADGPVAMDAVTAAIAEAGYAVAD